MLLWLTPLKVYNRTMWTNLRRLLRFVCHRARQTPMIFDLASGEPEALSLARKRSPGTHLGCVRMLGG